MERLSHGLQRDFSMLEYDILNCRWKTTDRKDTRAIKCAWQPQPFLFKGAWDQAECSMITTVYSNPFLLLVWRIYFTRVKPESGFVYFCPLRFWSSFGKKRGGKKCPLTIPFKEGCCASLVNWVKRQSSKLSSPEPIFTVASPNYPLTLTTHRSWARRE